MYIVVIETANLVEAPVYAGADGKQQYLGPGTADVVYFTVYGENKAISQPVRVVSTGSNAGKVFYGDQITSVRVRVNGLPDAQPFRREERPSSCLRLYPT
jgi:hypothetical protein